MSADVEEVLDSGDVDAVSDCLLPLDLSQSQTLFLLHLTQQSNDCDIVSQSMLEQPPVGY